jgi:hypothetical protein
VWQNASRKYLEKSAYDFAGLKLQEKMIGCAAPVADPSWHELSTDERARTLTRTNDRKFELRVEPTRERGELACDYAFNDAGEREVATDAAIAHALEVTAAP